MRKTNFLVSSRSKGVLTSGCHLARVWPGLYRESSDVTLRTLGSLLHESSARLVLKNAVIPESTRGLRFSKRPRDSFQVKNSGNLYACTFLYYSSAIEFEEIKFPRPILYDHIINF
jgi:hypothetical protein